jgi:aspartate kinase
MKFGGTSVGDASCIARAAAIIRTTAAQRPVVAVVSAMSGVTNRLVSAAQKAEQGGEQDFISKLIDDLQIQHITALEALTTNATSRQETATAIREVLAELERLLRGTAMLRELTPRALDAISGIGERLSAPLVSAAVNELGVKSFAVSATELIVTDPHHGRAEPLMGPTRQRATAKLKPLLDQKIVPIVTGFIAATPDGVQTTLGRGGSDYSATILGAALDAAETVIWTDVDGVKTADPRLVPEAQTIPEISYNEAAELAYFGAKVLHPATILPAVQKNIPVYVLNSRNAENEGTKITATPPPCASPFKSIAAKKKLTIIDIVASRMLLAHGFLAAVFAIFDKHGCAIDMVCTSEISVSVTVDSREALPAICTELSQLADVKYEGNKALICLVGEDIRGQSGISGQVFSAISHVNVRMISQGASEINMSFMVNEEDVDEALRSLHKKFFSAPDATIFDIEARTVSTNA